MARRRKQAMRQVITIGPLTATVRDCWIDASNRRLSADRPNWNNRPAIYSIVIETVIVEEAHRRQGHFSRFLATVLADTRFDMVVVEGVGNKILAEWLMRHEWDCDPEVMDFYFVR